MCVRELVSLAALWGSVQRGDDMHVCAAVSREGVGAFKGLQGGGREGWDCPCDVPCLSHRDPNSGVFKHETNRNDIDGQISGLANRRTNSGECHVSDAGKRLERIERRGPTIAYLGVSVPTNQLAGKKLNRWLLVRSSTNRPSRRNGILSHRPSPNNSHSLLDSYRL